ncbi:MAG: hypothetical protein AAF744_01105 [Pseudomonadota bacterium]
MKISLKTAALLALLPMGVAQAATTGEEDGMRIAPLSGSDFEVVSGSFTAKPGYFWCGAGSYIIRRQGQAGLTTVYLKRGIGPSSTTPGRRSVVFTTSAAGLPTAGSSLTLNMDRPGTALSARKARSYCRDAFNRSTK